MSLHARAMQNAGIVEHNIKCYALSADDQHAEFRKYLPIRDFSREKTDEEKTRYIKLEDHLMADTLRKSPGVITALSKTADNRLKEAKKPVLAIRAKRRAMQSQRMRAAFVRKACCSLV